MSDMITTGAFIRLWRTVYNIFFPLFRGGVRLAALFLPKVKASIDGRQKLFEVLESKLALLPKGKPRVLIHASSVGEFEQARPLIKRLREESDCQIFVSFLSVSGFEARKNFSEAELVTYLPEDTSKNAERFFRLLAPDVMIVVRYDTWFNHLFAAKQRGARLILIDAVLRDDAAYLKLIAKNFYRAVFGLFDIIFTVSERDRINFDAHFHLHAEAAGDTRFDQVVLRSQGTKMITHLRRHYEHAQVIVAGSTWPEDETKLLEAIKDFGASLIVVPHEVGAANIRRLESLLKSHGRTSERISSLPDEFGSDKILIVDQIGYLAELYALASVAYVGGGFGGNVHNVLEAAVHGVPVIYGPNISKSVEASELCRAGGGVIVETADDLRNALRIFLSDEPARIASGDNAKNFVMRQTGATAKIFSFIQTSLSQTTVNTHQEKNHGRS